MTRVQLPSRTPMAVPTPSTDAAETDAVVHLVAEYWPFARTGGLAEAARGIAEFQASTGRQTAVFMPLYRRVKTDDWHLEKVLPTFTVRVGPRNEPAQLYRLIDHDVAAPKVYFVGHPEYFDRRGLYGEDGSDYQDNDRRFAFFCRATLQVLPTVLRAPPVIHAHDWHTALAPVYLRAAYPDVPYYQGVGSVLTVHNAGFQGHFGFDSLADVGLPDWLFAFPYLEWYDRVNWLKGGLAFCDLATTVSPGHATELRTPEGGFGLHEAFTAMGDRFVGIVNGIDCSLWNPATDASIPAPYSVNRLDGKGECKDALQQRLGLRRSPRTPLFGMTARLVRQKGLDLVLNGDLLDRTSSQFVFLGEGEQQYQAGLQRLADRAPDRVAVLFDFTEAEEHRLLAAADFVLMPSLYEPCGLTQLRAQRYGALPVARRVGGLADTIADGETGFLFDDYTPAALLGAIGRGTEAYADPIGWAARQRDAMRRDFGWQSSGEQYQSTYRRAAAMHRHAVS